MKYLFLMSLTLYASVLANAQRCERKSVQNLAAQAEFVLIAKVKEVGSSKGYWSGIAPNIQTVTYDGLKIFKGTFDEAEITVGHLVVHNSLTADKKKPRLSTKLFSDGNMVLLLLRRYTSADRTNLGDVGSNLYIDLSENCGAIRVTKKNRKSLTKWIRNLSENGQTTTSKISRKGVSTPVDKENANISWVKSQLVTLTGKVNVTVEGDERQYTSQGQAIIFQGIVCKRCIYVAIVGEEGTYKIRVSKGRYRVIVEAGPTNRTHNALAPGQKQVVHASGRSIYTNFDINIHFIDKNYLDEPAISLLFVD